MSTDPPPVEQDSRGILHPSLMRQRVQLTRYPADARLDGLIDWFWVVHWDLPVGMVHRQQVLTHPAANLSVGHADADTVGFDPERIEARCYGVETNLSTRALTGTGWTVAALTTTGGLGALITKPVATLTDRVVPLDDILEVDGEDLIDLITTEPDDAARVAILADALAKSINPERVDTARAVAKLARLAEADRAMRTLSDLSTATGVGPRTLQRTFREYAGVSPVWVLRRYRLLDVAESVRNGEHVHWSDLAADLGYADQAHLIRDFRAAIGQTPAAYAAAQAVQPGSRPDSPSS